jgi:trans-aconitate 2-methyltransferase
MIEYAAGHAHDRNIAFQVADAAHLSFRDEFDLIVSFNALHWLPNPDPPLRSIHHAMKPSAAAQLRLVPDGPRKSLERVIEETRKSGEWARYFADFHDPYLHLTPEEYAKAAERNGLRVERLRTSEHAWDFLTRAEFLAACTVTFVAWTRRLPEVERVSFISNVLDNYEKVAADAPDQANTFKFYQLDVTLSRSGPTPATS